MKCIYSKLSNMMELSEQREKSKVEDFPFQHDLNTVYLHVSICNLLTSIRQYINVYGSCRMTN